MATVEFARLLGARDITGLKNFAASDDNTLTLDELRSGFPLTTDGGGVVREGNTLVWLVHLEHVLAGTVEDAAMLPLADIASTFFEHGAIREIRTMLDTFASVCQQLASAAIANGFAQGCLSVLALAVRKLQEPLPVAAVSTDGMVLDDRDSDGKHGTADDRAVRKRVNHMERKASGGGAGGDGGGGGSGGGDGGHDTGERRMNVLTSAHVVYLQLCIVAKNYKAAYAIFGDDVTFSDGLTRDMHDVDADDAGCGTTAVHVAQFYYYAGIVYVAMAQHAAALSCFEFVITIPCSALSAIAVESAKKWILLHLALHGCRPSIPKTASSYMHRHLDGQLADYLEYARTYAAGLLPAVEAKAAEKAAKFKKDNNYSLVVQSIEALRSTNIRKLTRTYVTVSLASIAESAHLETPAKAERVLFLMMKAQKLHARINEREATVEFRDDPESFRSAATTAQLHAQIQRTMALNELLVARNRALELNEEYAADVLRGADAPLGW